jgi:hypothetical protein
MISSDFSDTAQRKQLLRLAVQNLACAPQAQRRYVQMGWMRRAVENLIRVGDELDALRSAGELDAEQAALVSELREEVMRHLDTNQDFLEERDAAPREFLFGHALENAAWNRVRHMARRCHSNIAGADAPFAAIMAR